MNCITCRHIVIQDWEHERIFRCGHDSMSELDSNAPAREITRRNFFSSPDITAPKWCPYLDRLNVLPNQKTLFDDE